MRLQAFEVQVCAKAETRGLEMAHRTSFPLFLNCFRANQVGFKQVFDYLSVKHMDALRKKIQSLADFACYLLFLDFCNVKEILRMIARNN